MRLYSEETTRSLMSMRTRDELKAGKTPGPGGSLGKLHAGRIARMTRSMILEITGPEGLAWGPDSDDADKHVKSVLRSFSANIAGGTDEIQKNIIGDRVLGLPRDISVDVAIPFKDLKVGTQKGNDS
jgi:alkylation response protein AidB-like acyl-CoA dehydrogenase